MNANWFDGLARDVARGMPRREAVRLLVGTTALAVFGSWLRPGRMMGARSGLAPDPDCDGFRTPYRPDCPNLVPKLNYTPSVNGCGPEGGVFGSGINAVPNSPFYVADFTSACNGHDQGYGTCNRPKEVTDQQFLNDMYAACASRYSGGGMFNTIGLIQCRGAARTYYEAVSDLGEDAYKAGQAAACDCCECKGTGGKCMTVIQYRVLQERVVIFCKFLQANPTFQPTGKGLKLAGVGQGIFYQYTDAELNALTPVCTSLTQLINQIQ
jgi:hypothetical protein